MLNFWRSEDDSFSILRAEVLRIVVESGDPGGFDVDAWLTLWLASPNPTLGFVQPGSLLGSREDLQRVLEVLRPMQSSAYL